jgi:hypothetical protein
MLLRETSSKGWPNRRAQRCLIFAVVFAYVHSTAYLLTPAHDFIASYSCLDSMSDMRYPDERSYGSKANFVAFTRICRSQNTACLVFLLMIISSARRQSSLSLNGPKKVYSPSTELFTKPAGLSPTQFPQTGDH